MRHVVPEVTWSIMKEPHARRALATVAISGLLAAGLAAGGQPATASPGQDVVSLRDQTAFALASTLVGRNVTLRSARFVGDPVQAGTYAGVEVGDLHEDGVVLSTGSVIDPDPDSDDDVDFTRSSLLGPNASLTTTGDLGGAGDRGLTRLSEATTYDAAVLVMQVVPRGRVLRLTYALGSEEYAVWQERGYSDAFAVWVGGAPCSYVPSTRVLVGTDTVNADTHRRYYEANFAANDPGAGDYDTELNAFTWSLTCTARVTPGQRVAVRVAVADTGDGQLDTAALLQAGSLRSTRVPARALAPAAKVARPLP